MHKDRHVYRLIFVHISNYVALRASPLAGRKKASLTKREAFHTGIIMGTHPYRLISSSKPHHIGLIQGRCRGAERVVPLYLSHSLRAAGLLSLCGGRGHFREASDVS